MLRAASIRALVFSFNVFVVAIGPSARIIRIRAVGIRCTQPFSCGNLPTFRMRIVRLELPPLW